MPAKVVVIGSLNMDLVTRASRLPRAGETLIGDVPEHLVDERGVRVRRAQHVIALADDRAGVGDTAVQHFFVVGARCVTHSVCR